MIEKYCWWPCVLCNWERPYCWRLREAHILFVKAGLNKERNKWNALVISSGQQLYLYVLQKNGTNDVCNLSYHFSPLCWTDLSLQSFFYFSGYSIVSIDSQIFLTIVHLARMMMMYKFVLCLSMPLHFRR